MRLRSLPRTHGEAESMQEMHKKDPPPLRLPSARPRRRKAERVGNRNPHEKVLLKKAREKEGTSGALETQEEEQDSAGRASTS